MKKKLLSFTTVVLLLIIGCANDDATQTDTAPVPNQPAIAPPGTLVPTFTPLPDVSLIPTFTPDPNRPQPTVAPTATDIPFDKTVVEFRYTIPLLGLDRRLEGNIGNQITVVDETTGQVEGRNSQAGILLELQQGLPDIELATLPNDCDSCVHFQYLLPFDDLETEGWLQDPRILASVENYLTVIIGPHFPPDTIIALRRSASPYYPAHTIALTEDGRLFTWLATEANIDNPITTTLPIVATLADIDIDALAPSYDVQCSGEPIETLFFANGSDPRMIRVICPAFALPTTLQPLYLQLNQLLAEKLASYDGPARPTDAFPVDAILDYRRLDNTRLTIFANGRFTVRDQGLLTYADVLSQTESISLTNSLINSGALNLGLTTFFDDEESTNEEDSEEDNSAPSPDISSSQLLVRGIEGVWDGEFGAINVAFLAPLNQLLDLYLAGGPTPTPEVTEEAPPDSTDADEQETPQFVGTPVTAPTDEGTPTPESTATPTP